MSKIFQWYHNIYKQIGNQPIKRRIINKSTSSDQLSLSATVPRKRRTRESQTVCKQRKPLNYRLDRLGFASWRLANIVFIRWHTWNRIQGVPAWYELKKRSVCYVKPPLFFCFNRLERLDSVNAWVASYVTATKTNDRPGKESDLGAALDSLLPDNLDNKWGFRVS